MTLHERLRVGRAANLLFPVGLLLATCGRPDGEPEWDAAMSSVRPHCGSRDDFVPPIVDLYSLTVFGIQTFPLLNWPELLHENRLHGDNKVQRPRSDKSDELITALLPYCGVLVVIADLIQLVIFRPSGPISPWKKGRRLSQSRQ